jgi:hypothetical protein
MEIIPHLTTENKSAPKTTWLELLRQSPDYWTQFDPATKAALTSFKPTRGTNFESGLASGEFDGVIPREAQGIPPLEERLADEDRRLADKLLREVALEHPADEVKRTLKLWEKLAEMKARVRQRLAELESLRLAAWYGCDPAEVWESAEEEAMNKLWRYENCGLYGRSALVREIGNREDKGKRKGRVYCCGFRRECPIDAEKYDRRLTREVRQVFTNVLMSVPESVLYEIVVTLPTLFSQALAAMSAERRKEKIKAFLVAARSGVKKALVPGKIKLGELEVVQAFGDKNPEQPRFHAHFLLTNVGMEDGKLGLIPGLAQGALSDGQLVLLEETVSRAIVKALPEMEGQKFRPHVRYLRYPGRGDRGKKKREMLAKINHICKYVCRSGVSNNYRLYLKGKYTPTGKVAELVDLWAPVDYHRVTWSGYLAKSQRKLLMEALDVEEIEEEEEILTEETEVKEFAVRKRTKRYLYVQYESEIGSGVFDGEQEVFARGEVIGELYDKAPPARWRKRGVKNGKVESRGQAAPAEGLKEKLRATGAYKAMGMNF